MYTQEELDRASATLSIMAAKNGISEERMRAEIQETIDYARNNPDPTVQEKWKEAQFGTDGPSIEEFIVWVVQKTMERME